MEQGSANNSLSIDLGEDQSPGIASAVWIAAYVTAIAIVLLLNLPLLDYLGSKPPGRSVITDVVYCDLIKAELTTFLFHINVMIVREATGVLSTAAANCAIWAGLSFYGVFMAQLVTTSVIRYLVIFHFSFVNEISDEKVILFSRLASLLTGATVASLETAITGFRSTFVFVYLTSSACCEAARETLFMTMPILLWTGVATCALMQGLVAYKRLVIWKADSDVVRKVAEASRRLDVMRARAAAACLGAEAPFQRLHEEDNSHNSYNSHNNHNNHNNRQEEEAHSSALPRYLLATVVTLLTSAVLLFFSLSDVVHKYRPRGVIIMWSGFTGVLVPSAIYFTNANLRQHLAKRVRAIFRAKHRNVVSPG